MKPPRGRTGPLRPLLRWILTFLRGSLFCASCFFLSCAHRASAAKHPPNIVFILADDLGWADLGCYGNKFNETPNIDRLASQGVRFTQFYAAGPVCSPTRASIMSGQYQARFGLTAHIHGHWKPFEKLAEPPCALTLPTNIVTLPKMLRQAGYASALLGKWHLDWNGQSTPRDHGFDTALEFVGHTVAVSKQVPPGAADRRATDYLADKAIEFMGAHRQQPFFLYFCPSAVHIPLSTTPELETKYETKPKTADYSCHPLYAGLLEELDLSVGRILAALKQLELEENSIVIFTSDNGGLEREVGGWPGTSNRPLRSEKGSLYEGGIRVPLIVRWPGVTKAATRTEAISISTDFYPTLIEAAGLRPVKDQPLDGVNLLPTLRNSTAILKRSSLYWHYPHYHHSRPSGAIRSGDWKLIEFFDSPELELYNLKEDLGESNNLAPRMPERAQSLYNMLKEWRHSVNAQMPQINPAYRPARVDEWWNRSTIQPTEPPGLYRPAEKER